MLAAAADNSLAVRSATLSVCSICISQGYYISRLCPVMSFRTFYFDRCVVCLFAMSCVKTRTLLVVRHSCIAVLVAADGWHTWVKAIYRPI